MDDDINDIEDQRLSQEMIEEDEQQSTEKNMNEKMTEIQFFRDQTTNSESERIMRETHIKEEIRY